MSSVAHFVPTVPPEFNGLGDYAHRLWRHWPEPKPDWHVMALRVPEGASDTWPGVQFHQVSSNAPNFVDTLTRIQPELVFLHYVPHAYHAKGVPFWLPKALADWKRNSNGRVFVFFHELYATAPLWRVTGWLAPLARQILRQIVSLSDGWSTSCKPYFDLLIEVGRAKGRLGSIIPIGPNIVPPAGTLVPERDFFNPSKHSILVFGLPATRLQALSSHSKILEELADEGRIRKLSLVGAAPTEEMSRLAAVLIDGMGLSAKAVCRWDLSSEEVSAIMLEHDVALIATDPSLLGKSGVYAACRAHGLRCLLPGDPLSAIYGPVFSADLLDWTNIAARLQQATLAATRSS